MCLLQSLRAALLQIYTSIFAVAATFAQPPVSDTVNLLSKLRRLGFIPSLTIHTHVLTVLLNAEQNNDALALLKTIASEHKSDAAVASVLAKLTTAVPANADPAAIARTDALTLTQGLQMRLTGRGRETLRTVVVELRRALSD